MAETRISHSVAITSSHRLLVMSTGDPGAMAEPDICFVRRARFLEAHPSSKTAKDAAVVSGDFGFNYRVVVLCSCFVWCLLVSLFVVILGSNPVQCASWRFFVCGVCIMLHASCLMPRDAPEQQNGQGRRGRFWWFWVQLPGCCFKSAPRRWAHTKGGTCAIPTRAHHSPYQRENNPHTNESTFPILRGQAADNRFRRVGQQ